MANVLLTRAGWWQLALLGAKQCGLRLFFLGTSAVSLILLAALILMFESDRPEPVGIALVVVLLGLALVLVKSIMKCRLAFSESGIRRVIVEQLAQLQRSNVEELIALDKLPISTGITDFGSLLIQKQIRILEQLFLVDGGTLSGKPAAALTATGWARLETQEHGIEVPKSFTLTNMSNNFNNSPIGNFSSVNNSREVSINQQSGATGIDFGTLAAELGRLREAMSKENLTSQEAVDLGKVAQAEQCAQKADGHGVHQALISVGSWVVETATKIGTEVAVAAIKGTLG